MKRSWIRELRMALLAGCVVLLGAACTLFGAVTPQSPSEGLAYAYGTVATVRQSAATALQSGTISVATAQVVLKDTDEARAALDAGETVLITAPMAASGAAAPNITSYLTTAAQLLTAAQKLLPQQRAAVAGVSATK